jgi:hypothetical protein
LKGKKLKELNQKIKKQLTEKQSNISTKLSELKQGLKENEEDPNLPLKKRISRLVFLLSSRLSSTGADSNFIAAIGLLNHAYMIVEDDESMALKLFNVARNIARK